MHDTGRQPLNIADADGYNSVMLIEVCMHKQEYFKENQSFFQTKFFLKIVTLRGLDSRKTENA